MSTVTVVGASGAIGRRLLPFLQRELPKPFEAVGTHFSHQTPGGNSLDITSPAAIDGFVRQQRPETIVWLAGTKDVRTCEQDPDFAYGLNSRPVDALITSLHASSPATRVIYLSSDYVFDGARGSYRDTDACQPGTHYGRSKLIAEQALGASRLDHVIIRTSAVMIRKDGFLGWLLSELRSGKSVELFSNTFFSPTPIDSLDRVIAGYVGMRSWEKRIVHVAGQRMSRFQFGHDLAGALGLDASQVRGVMADFSNSTFKPDLSLVTSDEWRQASLGAWDAIVTDALLD